MTMRASIITVWVVILAGLGGRCVCLPGQTPNQPRPITAQSAPKRQGFFDYALGKINPQDKDYGTTIEANRSAVVGSTIDDLYFWSNVVTLILLCTLAGIVLLQWRAADKREVIAASLISQLWNGRVSDRIEIERRTAEFNRLVEAHNSEVERSLSQNSTPASQQADETEKLTRSVRNLRETGPKGSPGETSRVDSTSAATAESGMVSLQQDNLLLQRRVEALQNSEQNLKQRLNQITVLLDQERRRNATLKGA